jgi:hypothetical protein
MRNAHDLVERPHCPHRGVCPTAMLNVFTTSSHTV